VKRLRVTLSLALLAATACSSPAVLVAPKPPPHYEKVSGVRAYGSACGTLFFYSTVYSILPIMLTSRVDRAYQEALAKNPGATGLVNVDLQESWFWWILGTTYCTNLTGDAIRETPAPPPEAAPPEPAPPAPGGPTP
jgi:hypothetical protein